MQSRKSSILKPRKVREPLQDLNQLLPNNDDEETTTTDAQRRRVSFASMNKVKEYEAASGCVAVINAPPIYDKRFSISSTDLCQPAIPGKNAPETYQVTNTSRKSIPNSFKITAVRQSITDENVYFEEDVELTETIGRIYDIPMKSSGDSSMEMTHVITQTEIKCDESGEEIGPLNLTKESFNQTGNFTDAHIVEIEIVKNEKDADTSSMETTEVISNNIISIEQPDTGALSMETTEVISNNMIRIEKPDIDVLSMETTEVISSNFEKSVNEESSSMETTEIIYDNMLSESIKSQSAFFETLQSSQAIDDTANQNEEIEYISIRNFESPNGAPKRKSIFEMSARPLTNWDNALMCSLSHEKSNYNCSSTKFQTGNESKLIACDESLSLTCQQMANRIDCSHSSLQILSHEIEHRLSITNQPTSTQEAEEEIKFNSSIKTSIQETNNRTKYDVLSMQLLSQETDENKDQSTSALLLTQPDKTRCNNSKMELLTQEDDKTEKNNSNVALLTQEDNKTKYNNSNMELMTQEDKTKCNNSNMELLTQENKTKCNNSNMELLTQEDKTKCLDSAVEVLVEGDTETKYNNSSLPLPIEEENKTKSLNESIGEGNETEKSYDNLEVPEMVTPLKNDATHSMSILSKIVTPAVNIDVESEFIYDQVASEQIEDPKNTTESPETKETDFNELCGMNDVPHETTLRSSSGDSSNANDSNSPLKVDVNFSIFQKNEETRVEFSGTIDSKKKRKSISNVKVNIINNKIEKDDKRLKELRFSMPAITKVTRDSENNKQDFSATFTDFSIPNEDSSPVNKKATGSEIIGQKYSPESPQPAEPVHVVALNSSVETNDNTSSVQSARPPKKRLSNDAFDDTDESEVCPKRRSLSNDIVDAKNVPEALSSTETESNVSCAQLMRRSFTEIKQRKESFIREEKSILAIDDMVVEMCSRSTNTNVSYEARQLETVTDHEEKSIVDEHEVEVLSTDGQTHNQTYSSSASSSNVDMAKPKVEEHSTETATSENVSDQCSDGGDECNSRSRSTINQSSSQEEEELNDFSLHNPSIIVNIGDSFSHYKSMDLGTDNNVSASDIRESVDAENVAKPVIGYIDTDDISKENFVVEWLQNKTGKANNVENRLFTSSSDSSTLSTVKSVARGSEKPITASICEVVRLAQKQDTTIKVREIAKSIAEDRAENDSMKQNDTSTCEEPNDVCMNTKIESEFTLAHTPSVDEMASDIPEDIATINPDAAEKMELDPVEDVNDNMIPISKTEPEKEENSTSSEKTVVKETAKVEMKMDSDEYVDQYDIPKSILVSSVTNNDSSRMNQPSDETESNHDAIDGQPDQLTPASKTTEPVPCPQENVESPKSTNKMRQSADGVFVNSESTAEKRQKMSPEFERNKMETEPMIQSRNVKENIASSKRLDRHQQRNKKFETTRKDILEKITSLLKNGNQRWKLKIASDNKWIFQFFYDQLELIFEFNDDESSNACNASCQFVQPPYIKYHEISKIAVEYLIRKNESKLKKICSSVEDVPYLLKLIEPDVLYIEGFVADILRLCDSEIFKIKNGRAVFYVYSFKNIMSAKIQINVTRLEKLSVKDIHVEEIVGKADLNLIRNTFSEAGRDSDFFSQFVKKLWIVLDE